MSAVIRQEILVADYSANCATAAVFAREEFVLNYDIRENYYYFRMLLPPLANMQSTLAVAI